MNNKHQYNISACEQCKFRTKLERLRPCLRSGEFMRINRMRKIQDCGLQTGCSYFKAAVLDFPLPPRPNNNPHWSIEQLDLKHRRRSYNCAAILYTR